MQRIAFLVRLRSGLDVLQHFLLLFIAGVFDYGFHGAPRASAKQWPNPWSPRIMTLPLLVLAVGAVFAGWLGFELFVGVEQFWGDSIFILPTNTAMANAHHVPTWVKTLPVLLATAGVGLHFCSMAI